MSKMQKKDRIRGFTLIELLIVVSIVGILSAIGFYHFHQAQTRAKISVAQNNLRILVSGLEVYRVDHTKYPIMNPVLPDDPFGLLADRQLNVLTTPLAYVGSEAMRDPFGVIQQRAYTLALHNRSQTEGTDLPLPSVVNPNKSMLYYHYSSFGDFLNIPELQTEAIAVISIGPDAQDSFSVYAPFPESLPPVARYLGIFTAEDTLYDPTNGVISEGDIPRFTGSLPATIVP